MGIVQAIVYLLVIVALLASLAYSAIRIWPGFYRSYVHWWPRRWGTHGQQGIIQANLDNLARESWRCRYHPEVFAQHNCVKCGAPLRGQCAKELNGEYYCPDCIGQRINRS